MKIINILSIATFSLLVISCSKSSNDIDVKQADEATEMTAETSVKIEVVNELDPVCGMTTADHLNDTTQYKGKTYGFCNTMCKEKFLESPEEYANK